MSETYSHLRFTYRYDAKADLWSVGTVLFEMIAGKPPFNGENHIDLLRNIQRKAVRLPTEVRVSKECVNLLRILLNRNPLSRAGFREFFTACDAFVALGCEGAAQAEDPGTSHQPSMKMDLGTIHEDQGGHGAGSMMTAASEGHGHPQNNRALTSAPHRPSPPFMQQPGFVTPPLGPILTPAAALVSPNDASTVTSYSRQPQPINPKFAPLQPSPPHSSLQVPQSGAPSILNLTDNRNIPGQIQLTAFQQQLNSGSREGSALHSSTDDSEFVMVEHGARDSPSSSSHNRQSQARYVRHPTSGREYMVVNDARGRHGPSKGMLSTSPGTGGMLVNLMRLGSRPRLLHQNSSNLSTPGLDSQIESASKMTSAAEDVGRRAISVAHLGDTRAYIAMRCLVGISSGSSVISAVPMEGVEEANDEHSSANITDCDEASSHSTELAGQARKRISFSDRSMTDAKTDDYDEEDMPFAMPSEQNDKKDSASYTPIPSRSGTESLYKKSTIVPSKAGPKVSPQMVRLHFGEALSCYLKALSMIKSVLGAVQKVRKDVESERGQTQMNSDQAKQIDSLLKRCDMTATWLSGQFTGVLERADAANGEIAKLAIPASTEQPAVTNVKELIYNHSLACGRDAAVKHLLGQFEAARSCYRTAGLLAETLLMEPNVGAEDRNVLEGYVDGFSARITELDSIILQQSRRNSLGSLGTSKRGSGVIGIIGGIPPSSSGIGAQLRSPTS
jgi:hypothetical protein